MNTDKIFAIKKELCIAVTTRSRYQAALVAILSIAATTPVRAAKEQTVSISVKEAQACRGKSHIDLVVEFKNNGKEAVAIPFDFVGYGYAYIPEPRVKPGETRAQVGFYGGKPLSTEPVYLVIQPGGSERREIEIRLPPKSPPGTTHLDLFIIVNVRPQKKNHEGTKVLKGELTSPKIRLEYVDCTASQ